MKITQETVRTDTITTIRERQLEPLSQDMLTAIEKAERRMHAATPCGLHSLVECDPGSPLLILMVEQAHDSIQTNGLEDTSFNELDPGFLIREIARRVAQAISCLWLGGDSLIKR